MRCRILDLPPLRHCPPQERQFVLSQLPPLPLRQVSQFHAADGDAREALHGMADHLQHPSHLALAAFVDGDLEHRVARGQAIQHPRMGGSGHAVVEQYALAQLRQRGVADVTRDERLIALGDFVPRVDELIREFTVVEQEDQTLGVVVQATDRVDELAQVLGDKLHDRGAAFGVAARGYVPGGFVQGQVMMLGAEADAPAGDADVIRVRVGLRTQFSQLSVDRHFSFGDQRFAFAPRGDAGAREQFLHSLHGPTLLPPPIRATAPVSAES